MTGEGDRPGGVVRTGRGGLAGEEFEAVIRRAAELSLRRADRGDALLSEEEVVRIGTEVGLSREDVREALAEFRSGRIQRPGAVLSLLRTDLVRAARTVPRAPDEVAASIDEFLVGGQLLHPVRRSASRLQYRPAVDWMSKVARAASATARQHYVSAAERVEVHLEPEGERATFVEIEVDPNVRGGYLAGVISAATLAGAGIGVGAAVLIVEAVIVPAAAVAAAAGLWGGLTWITARVAGRAHLKRLGEVQSELEGILDQLETGEALEPPPASWRRWVRRHFHGVSRELGFGRPGHKPEQGTQ